MVTIRKRGRDCFGGEKLVGCDTGYGLWVASSELYAGVNKKTRQTKQTIDFQIKLLGALSVGDVRTGTIPSLLPSQKHYLKVYK
ncbi:MAG: hypothetical protein V1736_10100 [Pseudomonadota bacterium]